MHVKHNKKNLIHLDESDEQEEEASPIRRTLTSMMKQRLEGKDKLNTLLSIVSKNTVANQNESVDCPLASEEDWGSPLPRV